MLGVVKTFNVKKGYGFISIKNNEDVFVHHSEILMNGFRKLEPGQVVEFDVGHDDQGRTKAVGVTVTGR